MSFTLAFQNEVKWPDTPGFRVRGAVLLGDFGIARPLDDVSLTVTGSVMATIGYEAPR